MGDHLRFSAGELDALRRAVSATGADVDAAAREAREVLSALAARGRGHPALTQATDELGRLAPALAADADRLESVAAAYRATEQETASSFHAIAVRGAVGAAGAVGTAGVAAPHAAHLAHRSRTAHAAHTAHIAHAAHAAHATHAAHLAHSAHTAHLRQAGVAVIGGHPHLGPSRPARVCVLASSAHASGARSPRGGCRHTSGGMAPREGAPAERAAILQRAAQWVGVPYSMARRHRGWRADCSGYVSMAWGLDRSYTTVTLPQVSHRIEKSELQPGDILLNRAPGAEGHVVLFDHWADPEHTAYIGYEQSPGGTKHRRIPYPYFPGHGEFEPYRLNRLGR